MIFKVLYQPIKKEAPHRETTKTIYIEADDLVTARALLEAHTPYNIEFIQPLTGKHLEFEEKNSDFKLTEFTNEG
ncbi:MAG: DNA-directed RNA polymerase subunit epsilon [Bavariicoccus seileri]|uniref:DNA-directed RNA polymerase subunit epsilon n=1 Tax=Bavariicoccus seileri TaxID=549685 RepID=UPI003F9CFCE4